MDAFDSHLTSHFAIGESYQHFLRSPKSRNKSKFEPHIDLTSSYSRTLESFQHDDTITALIEKQPPKVEIDEVAIVVEPLVPATSPFINCSVDST